MECGHAGWCRPCANRLCARPPHQCPLCRAPIDLVVDLLGCVAAPGDEGHGGGALPGQQQGLEGLGTARGGDGGGRLGDVVRVC